uniref:Peptidase M14 domain-containing protein n=1 Tax=Mucochytrium quahogii TaxID=96639 RepID=A0A7S2SDR8_9STRA|mmetsp:Transcript_20720/g.33755  ORF Transcript_20720/g.33755 Transcript_20720/m.33755 type:complete len:538 (-) Transcript_20720:1281-2894(-)
MEKSLAWNRCGAVRRKFCTKAIDKETMRVAELSKMSTTWCKEFPKYFDIGPRLRSLADAIVGMDDLSATVEEVARSGEGRPIEMLVLEKDGGRSVAHPGDLMLVFGMHAREWITIAAAMCMVPQYILQISSAMQAGSRVLILPVLNPDGYSYSRTNNRHWRKNRSQQGDKWHGVDLNRNFGVENVSWGFGDPKGVWSELYQGRTPFSELESQALQKLVLDFIRPSSLVLDFHCCMKSVMAPHNASPKQIQQAQYISQSSDTLHFRNRSKEHGASNSGVAVDWIADQDNVEAAFIVELAGKSSYSTFQELFRNPPRDINPASRVVFQVVNASLKLGRLRSSPQMVNSLDSSTSETTLEGAEGDTENSARTKNASLDLVAQDQDKSALGNNNGVQSDSTHFMKAETKVKKLSHGLDIQSSRDESNLDSNAERHSGSSLLVKLDGHGPGISMDPPPMVDIAKRDLEIKHDALSVNPGFTQAQKHFLKQSQDILRSVSAEYSSGKVDFVYSLSICSVLCLVLMIFFAIHSRRFRSKFNKSL